MFDDIGGKMQNVEKIMFCNIGKKIQSAAKIVCYIGIGISIIAGLAVLFTAHTFWAALIGILGAGLGALMSWIGSWMVYAFGQLVDDVHALRGKSNTETTVILQQEAKGETKTEGAPVETKVIFQQAAQTESSYLNTWKCAKCGQQNPVHRGSCTKCGTYR